MSSKRLECVEIEKNRFQCNSTVESAWVRIWDTTFYKDYIDKCGIKWHEQYQDVMFSCRLWIMSRKVPCMDGSFDMMMFVKKRVGTKDTITLTVSTTHLHAVMSRKPCS